MEARYLIIYTLMCTFAFRLRPTPQTTWNDPTIKEKRQPPPPPPPPETEKTPKKEKKPEKKPETKPEKREQDSWFKIKGPKNGKVWYNEKTGKTQDVMPECLFKYR